MTALRLRRVPGRYAICRLAPDAAVPGWAAGELVSVTRTRDELSIVCAAEGVPDGVTREGPWVAWRVEGTLDLSLTGILARLAVPLAEAGVSLFAVSTYDTDHILVREPDTDAAVEAWRSAGHGVTAG
ncbi:ACT domain-containing protein [Carbonactinospora thermoautotrophica]|uniref:Amino acid-binding ACT domain protein n=1 Tax=Carbonactinospora thermoautotrophica TaxID=1469144 RepID=A0A132MP42_9ACTN|nr:ACT domain-containing protein [Carbonactinospora thermoautotrophica]KWW99630.1 Amino acid-binding ACT domain protein [Carbonactinospora thermoautotrophica]KWX03995.1 hypothetical protein TH66_08535 [Carbonactinospora thermoautotrophica]KWX09557.1 hypothetical protein TR74_08860 [Carbonactinospora thermoautotrophica]MCX9191804.1 ACT domain-containing protein [Carbonactinospora thermoautotrophica]